MPFIPTQNNASTVSSNLERGWRDRQAKATDKFKGSADWREIDAVRQAAYAEKARQDREQAELSHARHTAKVSCPVCDHGTISAETAEKVIRALAALPAASQPDQDVLAKLITIAAGRPVDDPLSLHPSLNLHAPRRAVAQVAPVAMVHDDAAGDDASALDAHVREEQAREAEIAAMREAVEAEAQEAAAPVPAPAPDPVSPRKHRGHRTAPLPFLGDDA